MSCHCFEVLVRRGLSGHKTYKGPKTGGYTGGAHLSAIITRIARSKGGCWNIILGCISLKGT